MLEQVEIVGFWLGLAVATGLAIAWLWLTAEYLRQQLSVLAARVYHRFRNRFRGATAPLNESPSSPVPKPFSLPDNPTVEQIEWMIQFERERGRAAYAEAEQLEALAARARGHAPA